MENLEIIVSDDKLKAFLKIKIFEDAEDLDIEKKDIEKALKDAGITYGIKEDKITEVVEKDNYLDEDILIAEGKAALPGKDGELIYHFEEKQKQAGTMRADGTMDFHSLDLINNVRVGEKIVTKIEAEAGTEGTSVYGKKLLPPPVKEFKLPRSKNTVKKGESLYSAVDGQIVREFQKIIIKEVYIVNGDVDLKIGNIDFVGSVKINGDVKAGFTIKAEGDIEIAGKAGACELISGDNILIKKGFIGRNKATAEAKGNFLAKFIENAAVTAENVRAYGAIMHSSIKARNSVEVTEGRGLIVGGKITARNKVTANSIGSGLATKTVIEIGMMPELKEKLKNNKKIHKKTLDDLNKIEKSIDLLENIKERGIKLPADKKQLLNKLEIAGKQLSEEKEEVEETLQELKKQINVSKGAAVEVKEELFSGVQILTAHDKRIIQNKKGKSKFQEIKKQICQVAD